MSSTEDRPDAGPPVPVTSALLVDISDANTETAPSIPEPQKPSVNAATEDELLRDGQDEVQQDPSSPPPPPLPPKDEKFLGQSLSTQDDIDSTRVWNEKELVPPSEYPTSSRTPDLEFDEKRPGDAEDPKLEIQNIVEQFGEHQGSAPPEALGSPVGSELPVFQYPPRSSSLEPYNQGSFSSPTPDATDGNPFDLRRTTSKDPEMASLHYAPSIASQPPLPEPDPEPDLPFDFHRFLEQLRHRTADPVAKFLRSFLQEFGKKQWQVHEQVKIIGDFLTFISGKMAQCEVWRTVSDAEFDNAREGMEKLVMNRLYAQTFSPEIPPAEPSPVKNRRKGASTPLGPGRKGQHQEDVERDEVLAQKVRIYGWIREEHLDIRMSGDKGKKFLTLAQQELSKIKSYRAPRDKVICVLNCCKVLFGFLRNSHSDQSADAFIPLLIYTVLKANPDHLVSNVQYILRFRNPDKLGGEAGYYMSSLMGAVQFIENLDRTNLTISDEEFEQNVEAAVSSIAEPHLQEKRPTASYPRFVEKSSLSRPEVTTRHSEEAERANPRRAVQKTGEGASADDSDENAAVAGLLRTIQKPLSTIGRIFSEDTHKNADSGARPPSTTPQPSNRPPRTSSIPVNGPAQSAAPGSGQAPAGQDRFAAEEAAARQASAEAAEAHRVMRAEHHTVVETLAGMFPDLDKDVISDVVRMKDGQVGQAVDACLALSR